MAIEARDFTPSSLREAMNDSWEPDAPAGEQDADTGIVEQREPVIVDDPPVDEAPVPVEEPAPVDPAPLPPVAAEDEDEAGDDDLNDPDFIASRVGKRIRVRSRDANEAKFQLLLARNRDMTPQEAFSKVYGVPAAAAPVVEDSAPVVTSESLEAELDALSDEIAAAETAADYETKAQKEKEFRAKTRAHTKLLLAEQAKPAAKAPEQPAPEPAADNTAAFQSVYDADWAETCENYPEAADQSSPLFKEMLAIHGEWKSKGDPRLSDPRLNSLAAAQAAKKLKLAPVYARPAAPPPPRPAPGPLNGGNRSEVAAPPRVDHKALVRALTPQALAAALGG